MDQHQSPPGPTQTAAAATASRTDLRLCSCLLFPSNEPVIACFYGTGLVNPVKHFLGVAVYISPFSTWNYLGKHFSDFSLSLEFLRGGAECCGTPICGTN